MYIPWSKTYIGVKGHDSFAISGEHTRDEETREVAMKSEIEEQKRKERLDNLWSSFKDNDRNTPVNLESTTSSVASTKGNIASSNEKKVNLYCRGQSSVVSLMSIY